MLAKHFRIELYNKCVRVHVHSDASFLLQAQNE